MVVFQPEKSFDRAPLKCFRKHPVSVSEDIFGAMEKGDWHMANFYPALGAPSQIFYLFGRQMFGPDNGGRSVILIEPIVDNQSGLTEIFSHGSSRIWCRVLNIRPIEILVSEF